MFEKGWGILLLSYISAGYFIVVGSIALLADCLYEDQNWIDWIGMALVAGSIATAILLIIDLVNETTVFMITFIAYNAFVILITFIITTVCAVCSIMMEKDAPDLDLLRCIIVIMTLATACGVVALVVVLIYFLDKRA